MASSYPFPSQILFTGYDEHGESRFIEAPEAKILSPPDVEIGVLYRTAEFGPIELNEDADLKAFGTFKAEFSNLFTHPTVVRLTFAPGAGGSQFMHRTPSVDYCVIISGQAEYHLDSGEKRTVGPGDVVFARGPKHYWVNTSQTEPVHMLAFGLPSNAITAAKPSEQEFESLMSK